MRNKSLHQLFLTLLILSFPFVTATATNYYETMEVGETRDFTGFTPQPLRTGYVGIVDYTWSLDAGGDKILTIKPDVYVSCTVKAIAEGTACLTFQANSTIIGVGGSYPLLKQYFITVKKGTIKVTSVSITPSSVSLNVGDTKQLSKTILPSDATNQTTTWSSNNTSVASVNSSGLVTANATGNATITCKANDGSGKQATCVISVSKAKPVPVDWISLSYSSISLIVGNARQLSATVSPSNATDKTLAWTSSNSSVASVSSSGLVTAKSAGSATITCKANDGSGKYATCNVTVTNPDVVVAEINATNFPDASFRSWLLSQTYGTDGKLTENEIKNITSIYVSGSSSSPGTIRSLKGIEYFTSLKSLYCSYNQLTSLDVSRLTALTYLSCGNNQLTSLDVSRLTALTDLSCYKNQLTSLDVSRLTALTYLSCSDNQLTSLDVSNLTALTSLSCENNQLTSLDVSRLTALTSLYCYNNQLTSLNVSNLTALKYLSCPNNQLTSLNVSRLTALTSLSCGNNQLTSLDVSRLTALTSLSCGNNQLTSLDVSNLTALKSLYCSNNQLTSLDVSKLTALTSMNCGNNQLTALDVSKLTVLQDLYCDNNQLSSLDVSKNKSLKLLCCYNNGIKGAAMDNLISSLPKNNTGEVYRFRVVGEDLSNESNVCTTTQVAAVKAKGWFPCYYDSTTKEYVEYEGSDDGVVEINATNFPDASFRSWLLSQSYGADGKLTGSEISTITKIDVKGSSSSPGNIKSLKGIEYFTALTELWCGYNKLTSLDVSRLTALKVLSCSKNQLTSLDVSRLTALTHLFCAYNQLTSLDVSRQTALTLLDCYNNQLISLDVSRQTALTSLSCENNQLTSLDVSNLTALKTLWCNNNQLTVLDVSNNTVLKDLRCYRNKIKGSAMDALVNGLLQKSDGEYILYVIDNSENNEGNVCTKTQVKAVKAKGWFPCYYNSTTKEYVEYEGSDATPTTKGDVNGDNQVNGTDLVALTNIILGKSSKTDAADVNGDGYVNGTDYVALANIVLGRSNAKATAMAKGAIQAAATTGLSIEPFDIKAGETKEMVIDLSNPSDDITLVQFDLRLPKGLSVKQSSGEYDFDIAGRTTWRKHSLDANATNGIVRFLLASSSNATLTGTEGAVIKITVLADNNFTGGDIQLENILMVTPAEKEIKQSDVNYTIGTTGIKGVASGNIEKDAPIYNLSGQRLDKPRKGINIIGGKKVIIK